MEAVRSKALSYGATEFGKSKVKGKRFYVIYDGKRINFGSDVGSSFIDHHDEKKRKAWYARHSKIKNKLGEYVINLKSSPDWWSAKILW
jgi:hypothetical protein